MDIAYEWKFILFFAGMLSFFAGLIYLGLPQEYQLFTGFDLGLLGTNFIVVATGCGITTGIGCVVAMAFFGITTLLAYVVVSFEIIKIFVIVPLMITLIFIVAKLGSRGGG